MRIARAVLQAVCCLKCSEFQARVLPFALWPADVVTQSTVL